MVGTTGTSIDAYVDGVVDKAVDGHVHTDNSAQVYTKDLKKRFPLCLGSENPVLRSPAASVTFPLSDDMKELANALPVLMEEYDGVGLAAPQVGQSYRMLAITTWRERKGKKKYTGDAVLINPRIVEHSSMSVTGEEACLSLPGEYGRVQRWKWVRVQYYTPQGQERERKYSGFTAVVVQHEIDHLDGVLFIDKLV